MQEYWVENDAIDVPGLNYIFKLFQQSSPHYLRYN